MITSKQWFQIISGSISGLITAGALFTSLFGQDMTLKIIASLGLVNIILSSVGAALSGQSGLVKDVAAMPGVESIKVNSSASSALATLAVDPAQDKVSPTQSAEAAVQKTAAAS